MNKIEKAAAEYGLEGAPDELVRYWTADDDTRKSTRELMAWFNERILRASIEQEADGEIPGDYTVTELVQLLRDHDEENHPARRDLRGVGVPVEDVASHFVSRGTVHRYLTEIRGESISDSTTADRTPVERETAVRDGITNDLERIANQLDNRLQTLRTHDQLPAHEPFIDVQAVCECPACSERQPIIEYISNCGCTACDLHTRPTTDK